MTILRKDGNYSIYQIMKQNKDESWSVNFAMPENANGAATGKYPVIKGLFFSNIGTTSGECSEIWDKTCASGECWQTLGIYGLFNRSDALMLLEKISADNPTMNFKISVSVISQMTYDIKL
jgi:hypothetical protein